MRAIYSLVVLHVSLVLCLVANLKADVTFPGYRIKPLGTLGGSYSAAYSVNNAGQVTGVSKTSSGGEQAFLFDGFIMTELPSGGEAVMNRGAHINDSGVTVGTTFLPGSTQPVLWMGRATVFSNFGGTGGSAMGINNAGQIVGNSQFSDGHAEAFLLNGGTMTALGVLSGGDWSSANDINSTGQVVGSATIQNGSFRAFSWTSGGGLQSLGTLGGGNSYAMAVNDSGVVTGHSQNAYGWTHAYRSINGTMDDLGTLGGNNSYGYGTNANGDVVGYSEDSSGNYRGFLYRQGALVDLNSLLLSKVGWTLEEAYDINDKGQIVGVGTVNGLRQAFLLDAIAGQGSSDGHTASGPLLETNTPEPASLLLVFFSLAAFASSRFRLQA